MGIKNEERIRGEQVFFCLQREGWKSELNQGSLRKMTKTSKILYWFLDPAFSFNFFSERKV
ncbi:MAG: hypothetical protein ACFFB0_20350 [Promethearchaeota archaeon]